MVFKKEGVKGRIVKTYEEKESSIGTYRSVELLIETNAQSLVFGKHRLLHQNMMRTIEFTGS